MGDQNKRVFRAKTAGRELLETNPLDFTVVQLLWNSQVIRAGESLTVRNAARFARGLTERQALWTKQSSKKRQTKPIEISHKPLALKELTSIHSDLLVQNEPIYERPVVKRGGADFVSQGSRTSPSPSASVDLAHLR